VMQWFQAAWVAGTPTEFPMYWVVRRFKMYLSADICSLWAVCCPSGSKAFECLL
jgi:hypothetical protein